MKIAIIGTHGVGKTTLTYKMAAKLKSDGKSVKIVQEVARSCPFPLNDEFTASGAIWIYHEQVKKELEAQAKFEYVICDRSCLDSLLYARALKIQDPYLDTLMLPCFEWLKSYDEIIYVTSSYVGLFDDGIRSTDKEFQLQVEECFDDYLSGHDIKVKKLNSTEIFEDKWISNY